MTYFQKVLAGAVVCWGQLCAVAAQLGNVPTATTLRRVWYGVGAPSKSTRAAIKNLDHDGELSAIGRDFDDPDPTARMLRCRRAHKKGGA